MLLYETRGEKYFHYYYDSNGTLCAVNYRLTPNGTDYTYYYTHNWRGDIVGIYNGNGDLRAKYTYDSWGNVTSITDGNGNAITSSTHIGNLNPFRYRGYYMDTETGMYYLMSRYYDPVTHRFVNADGYFQTGDGILDANMNAYCKNNPIMYMDNNGDFAILISIAAAFEAAIVATTVALVAVLAISIVTNPSFQQSVSDAFSSVGSWSGSSTYTYESDYTYESEAEKDLAPHLRNKQYNYWSATIVDGVVTPITPLSYSEAREWVEGENNLLCRDHKSAIAIVKFYPSAIWDEAHGSKENGYLDHYHLSSAHNNHIWYYGE